MITEAENKLVKKRILIADDKPEFVGQFERLIKKVFIENFSEEPEIITAKSGEQAIEILDKDNRIDYGIIDYEFPEGERTGLEVMETTKNSSAELLGISGFTHAVRRMREKNYRAFDKDQLRLLFDYIIKKIKDELREFTEYLNFIEADLAVREESLKMREAILFEITQFKREPYLNLRIKSFWYMVGFLLLWLTWKFSGYVILNPFWAIVGMIVSMLFFAMSYALKADISSMQNKDVLSLKE